MSREDITAIFTALGANLAKGEPGLNVTSPIDGQAIANIRQDTNTSLDDKIHRAQKAQSAWATLPRAEREALLNAYAAAIKDKRELLATCLHLESAKTMKEAFVEADGSNNVLLKTVHDAALPESSGMLRTKERPPVGVVGLITSFNFPMVVAHWTIAPALLAGNGVVWKPSEKTPLVALACKAVFDGIAGDKKDLLQIVIGGRDVGQWLVTHPDVGMVSATGSVAMGKAIEKALDEKEGNVVPPVLELGGNNGVIISDKTSDEHLQFAVDAIMGSFLGTTGQRCTNTRRLIVHKAVYGKTAALFESAIETFLQSAIKNSALDADNAAGYSALIDADAFLRFEHAKKQVVAEGGSIVLGNRILQKEFPNAYYVEPALALMKKQTPIMFEETFAPILFLAPYETFDDAIAMVNAPNNAGLVNGIYTQSQKEADLFALKNEAGHGVINSPKGTGTPAFGMGFGGNKDSGCGEILNSADPLAAFTRPDRFRRIAQNKEIVLDR